MDMNFKRLMADATRLTRGGDPAAATRAILQALGGGDDQQGTPARAEPASHADRVIDGQCTHLDDADGESGSDVEAKARSDRRDRPGNASGPAGAERVAHRDATPERILRGRHADRKGGLDYRLFLPARTAGSPPPPLLVMLHGCTQNAEDFALGTRMDALARRHGCQVLYPDQADGANPQRCWNWFKHTHQRRGGGEAGLIERCTRAVMAEHGADPQRVFVAGLSAGGAMAAILGSVCADLFTGVGVHSGLAAGAATNLPEALTAMQRGAPAVAARTARGDALPPTIVFHGDADRIVHPDNAERIVDACVVAAAGAGNGPPPVNAAGGTSTIDRGKAAGTPHGTPRRWTRQVHRDATGRIVAEHWCVHGTGHAWSGGDGSGSHVDPSGPNASAEMMRFFLAL